ncbi:inosine-uridine preferring nucleoside hydrolase [Ameyamaea chiangmaiensis NBRC 103196]|uniref:Nucleoside hydrolase n=1 Tax=Ameyamaea chiangmaiensis TaxID=442969 RepID=A0A850P9T9_9PROT|nr:nucleoside hydrolase [Ameyamaea chiangmaiensis]MBS4074934.1 nucleoside hydrolase [Ameyamaea chiangmaiensis]NVN41327.1 nucleoside hydrolase [Ameyamaea chiangmaiensis]GBQ63250.1 inosine-uridine preferring nucleoside hydrolase [Ameyamaea chiangmaiensis NBRC 103196]
MSRTHPARAIIFDTDPGVDDVMALAFLTRLPGVELRAITTTFGNLALEATTRNALTIAERFGLDVPVAQGAAHALQNDQPRFVPHVHGADGLGDVHLPVPRRTVDPRPAADVIIDLVRRDPGAITLVGVGPFTNLAHALHKAPEIAGLVAGVSLMGGAFGTHGHTGNVSPVAEANVAADPWAADIVLGASWPVTMIGLDVTQEVVMDEAYLAALRDQAADAGRLIWDISRFYQRFHEQTRGLRGVFAHDSLAVAHAVRPDLFTTRSGSVRAVAGGIAHGQTIQKPRGLLCAPSSWDDRPEQAVAVGVDGGAFLDLYRRVLVA